MRRLVAAVGGIAALAVITSAYAQAQEGTTAAAPTQQLGKKPSDENISQEERTAAFIAAKQQWQQRRGRDPTTAVGGAELAGLQGLVKAIAVVQPRPPGVWNPNQLATLSDLFTIEIAQRLAALGFKAGDLRGANRGGAEIVEAAAASVRGSSTLQQELLLADTAAQAEVVSFRTDLTPDDGYRSTLLVRVVTPVKGVEAGQLIAIRQVSGEDQGRPIFRTSDFIGAPGTRIYLLASEAAYRDGVRGTARGGGQQVTVIPTAPIAVIRNGVMLNEASRFSGQPV